jgi:hypothetical protein
MSRRDYPFVEKKKARPLPRQGLPFASWVAPDGANYFMCIIILQTGSPYGIY